MGSEAGRAERQTWRTIAAVLVLLGVALSAVASVPPVAAPGLQVPEAPDLQMPGGFFTENAGQIQDERVRFYSSGDIDVGFGQNAVLLKLLEDTATQSQSARTATERLEHPDISSTTAFPLRGVLIRLSFEGSNPILPEGVQEMPHRSNYFLGNDPSAWRTGVRSYAEVRYENLYDGIDLIYRIQDGRLKYDFVVAPGADPSVIGMTYEGVESVGLDAGELVLATALGDLREQVPFAFQGEQTVECAFVPRSLLSVGFACEGRDASRTLVIDPLIYATYLGGGDEDRGYGIAVDASGSAYVAGALLSTNFPATPGAFNMSYSGAWDAFVAKLNATGDGLAYATYLGGSQYDEAYAIAVDATGYAYMTGATVSTDFPVSAGANDTTRNGGVSDVFVAKLNQSGTGLVYSTFLGGTGQEVGYGIAVDTSGIAFVAGFTGSTDFPVTPGANDTTPNGGRDGFVAKLDAAGAVFTYATYLGGALDDYIYAIAADASGNAFVTGHTWAVNFPVTLGAYNTTLNGNTDAFVAKLNASGSGLVYATYLGGSDYDYSYSIAVDATGSAFVTGTTPSTDFPTTLGANDATFNGVYDSFVAKLNASGNGLAYSTHLGGNGDDVGYGIALDASGAAIVTGTTSSGNFPVTTGAYDEVLSGLYDVFVAKLDASGGALPYASFLGGAANEVGWGLAIDAAGMAYLTGRTYSSDFPATPGAYDVTFNGNNDAIVAKLDLVPASSSPTLGATGESNYVGDGLDPETGTLATSFTFRVMYTDADDDPAAAGDPRVHILSGAVEVAGSPFAMTGVDALDVDVTDGKLYAFATTLSARATNYTYYFNASDDAGNAAPVWPSSPADAPDVLNQAPTADAGLDQPGLFRAVMVTFNGTGSSDSDGDALTYSWTQASGPAVTLTGANTTTPSFTPTQLGTYTFNLTVDDGFGGNVTDNVTMIVVNRAPTADAGPDQPGRSANTTVSLDGTGSSDPDTDALTFSWTQVTGPTIALTGNTTGAPSFTPTLPGTYTFDLLVDDGQAANSTDTVVVTVVAPALDANAGQNQQNVTVGTVVTLNGSQSSDPEGDNLTYSWVRTSGPSATLANADTATPTFTPTVAGTYVFTLTVSDGTNTATDTVTITVVDSVTPPTTPSDNTMLIVGAVLALVVLVVLVLLLAMRKRKKPEETPSTAPQEPGETE